MDPVVRPRTSVFAAWIDGWRRVVRAPWLVVGLTATGLAANQVTWPLWPAAGLKWVLDNDALAFGGSLTTILQVSRAEPLTFVAIGRVGDFLIVNLGIALMLFLTGGAIDRLARGRALGAATFFGITGDAFLRLLRVSVVLGGLTWLWMALVVPQVIAWLPPLVNTTSWLQPRALALIGDLIGLVILGLLGDYTRVRLVVEDRRSALGAIGAGLRFVRRRPLAVVILTTLNLIAGVGLFWAAQTIVSFVRPSDSAPRWMLLTVSVGAMTLYALVQTLLRLGFIGAAVSYFQSELAHAGYTARPVPAWPDSAAVEAIANLEAHARGAGSDPAFRV
jgi:hypothetical protein